MPWYLSRNETQGRYRDEHDLRSNRVGTGRSIGLPRLQVFQEALGCLQERRERQKLRDALSNLSDRDLMDIGISRGEIDYVASHRGIDPRGIRSTEWVRHLPMWDGQIGPF